jgi:hypothetical protein
MEKKKPWQTYIVALGSLFGILYIINFMYYDIGHKKSVLYYCIMLFLISIFLAQIVALFIRREWSYYVSLALLIPIGVSLAINMLFIFMMPSIWLVIIPVSVLTTLYSLLCSATRKYYGVR